MIDDPIAAARDRAVVVLDDGRMATLHYWPNPNPAKRRQGCSARVQLTSGAWLSVPTDSIVERWM